MPENDVTKVPAQKLTKSFLRDSAYYKVILIAVAKLVLYGLLFYTVLYNFLKESDVFRTMTSDFYRLNDRLASHSLPQLSYPLYFLGGLALASALYLYIVALIGVTGRIRFFLYSLLFGLDLLFVLQPSKLLLSVLFFAVLMTLLRIRSAVIRYSLSAALILLYGIFLSHTVLLLIPLYALIRLWQKSDIWGIRVVVVLIAVFCLLYQDGHFTEKLFALRPNNMSQVSLPRVFPDENYMAHVTYFLLDSLFTWLRCLFPVEVFFKASNPLLPILAAAQIVTVIGLISKFRIIIRTDWRNATREERYFADILALVCILLCGYTFTVKEYFDILRLYSAFYPMYLYLFFAAPDRITYPVVDRDLKGLCPVVFFHKGREPYLSPVLRQAGSVCGYRNIVLLGNEDNRGFIGNWYDADLCGASELTEFRSVYKPIGDAGSSDELDLLRMERHFSLYAFMKQKNLDHCYLCDSDVLLFENPGRISMEDTDFACTCTESSEFLNEIASPHCTYWTQESLRQFLGFILHVYRNQTKWLEEVVHKQQESQSGPGRITDFVLLTAWRKLTTQYNKTFAFRNLCKASDGVVWDFAVSSPDNMEKNEYEFNRSAQIKKIRFVSRHPYIIRTEDRVPVRAVCLHCKDCHSYIPLLIKRVTSPFWYKLQSLLH